MESLLVSLTWENMNLYHDLTLSLIALLYHTLWTMESTVTVEVFKLLPNVNGSNFQSFHNQFRAIAVHKHRKDLLKSFLTNVVGLTMGTSVYKKKSNILELPDQFFSAQLTSKNKKKNTKNTDVEDEDEEGENQTRMSDEREETNREEVELQYIASIFGSL